MKRLGIKAKVLYGCLVIGIALFFAGTVSIFEYARTNRYVTSVITDNINSISTSSELLHMTDQYNAELMYNLVISNSADSVGNFSAFRENGYSIALENLRDRFSDPREVAAADSVVYAYVAYMQVASEAEEIWNYSYDVRSEWFFNRLQPVHQELRRYLMQLTQVCQNTLTENTENLQAGYYRGLMPGVVSGLFGIVLVMFLNYYLRYYLINPLLRITTGIKRFKQFGRSYDVRVETEDEMAELNEVVKDIVDLNQSYKKKLKQ